MGRPPSVARLNGRNIVTVPRPRRTSGQKSVDVPVFGLIWARNNAVATVITAPQAMRTRASTRGVILLIAIIITAEARAPGIRR